MGQRRSREQWDQIVSAYVDSGMSRAAFASAFGVPLGTLQYQLRLRSGAEERAVAAEGGFVEVPWTPSTVRTSDVGLTVEVRLGDTVTLRASSWPPASWLAEVLGSAAIRRC